MNKQQDLGLKLATLQARREVLPDDMALVMPWVKLVALIAVHAPSAKTGRLLFDLQMMLGIHRLERYFGLSDMSAETALFETDTYRAYLGLSGADGITYRLRILRFGKTPGPRHLLKEHGLSPRILQAINDKLCQQGLMLKAGTMVDVTHIAAPNSTKNIEWELNPEMHHAKKGDQWHFGMKAYMGVDTEYGIAHTGIDIVANFNDVTQGLKLLYGNERIVFTDAGYLGTSKRWRGLVHGHASGQTHTAQKHSLERIHRTCRDTKGQRAGQSGASVSHNRTPVRAHRCALRGLCRGRGATHHTACAVHMWLARKVHRHGTQAKTVANFAGTSSRETYSPTAASQTEF